ncbi:MAG TPA: 30S ribosomal protein S3ae [Candidatus Poseidoniales archaeon]|nr:MAG TPA: 30S ribosomal protein S3ae [Candidatus Poseidoniales archaeon]|tara:strand:- start:139 stop:1107 length:969 start_codon:yes stop_codon:yes gene_type:complete
MSDMAKKMSAKARAAARKQRDKWKTKRWYTIRAPRHPWNYQNIGETIGESDEHIIGRIYEMTQQEFNGDFTKMHVMLRFRVSETVGQDALTTFVGHHHQTNHIRRQIRRYRGKIDDVIDVVTEDGYLVRIKPLIITQKRVQTSVKQSIRAKTRDVLLGYVAKTTYDALQVAMLDGSLETEIQNQIKTIYPCRSVVIRKSQLLQEGVEMEEGPTLDEIHAEEARKEAEIKAKKAAALAEAMAEEQAEDDSDEEDSTDEVVEEVAEAEETPAEEVTEEEAPAEEPSSDDVDYSSMTVAELKELLKAAGKPVSGKKAELIERLQE